MKPSKLELPLRATLLYLLFGGLWILLSDRLLLTFLPGQDQQSVYQTLKGWFFVLGSGVLLYFVLLRDHYELKQAEHKQALERARWQGIVEGIADEVWMCDTQGKMSLLNLDSVTKMGLNMFRDRSVMEVYQDVDIFYPDGQPRPPEQAPLLLSLQGEIVRGEEIMTHRQTGKSRYRQFSSAPTRDNDGTITGAVAIVRDVTEQKEAEEGLRRYELLSQHSRDIILFIRREDGIILEVNAAALQAYGYSREELLTLTIRDLRAPDSHSLTAEQMAQADAHGVLFETIHQRKDGSTFPVEVSSQGASIGNVRTLVSIVRDITERKEAEEHIRYQAQLLENVNDAIVASDAEYILRVWNPAAERMYGWKAEEVIGKNGVNLLQTEFPDQDPIAMRQMIAEVGCYVGEAIQRRRDGTNIEVEVASKVLRDESGEISGYVSVNRDITERKQQNKKIAWLASFPERNPNPVVEIDATGMVFYMNPAAQRKFPDLPDQGFEHLWLAGLESLIAEFQQEGLSELEREVQIDDVWYSQPIHFVPEAGRLRVYGADITLRKHAEENVQRSEAMLRSILDQMPSGVTVRDAHTGDLILSNARSREIMGALVKSANQFAQYRGFHTDGRPYQIEDWPVSRSMAAGEIVKSEEIRYERRDGTHITLSISSAPVRDKQGQIVMGVGVVDDTTDRKQAEESLHRLTEDLRRSNAELERFAYIASHDLQEPLRMVSSYVQLLSKRYQGRLDSDADEFIAFAVDGAKRMQNLINDLLMYSRVGTRGNPLTAISSEDVLKEAIVNLQFLIEENGAQISHEPMPIIYGDPIQLAMVFQNLLGNAIKFRGSEPPRIHIGIGVKQETSEWVFSVRDNGIGIDPQFAERIFVIFQRLHSRSVYPGTGIGLAICERIIQRHGGRIWVESMPGEGATFYFTLPIKEPQ